MAVLTLSLYDMPGFAPHMNVLFWRPDDLNSCKLHKQGYLSERL